MNKTEEDVARLSAEASQVWNHPLVKDFMDNYVRTVFILWLDEQDPVKREQLWAEAHGATAFKARFLSHMAGGRALERKKSGDIAANIGAIV